MQAHSGTSQNNFGAFDMNNIKDYADGGASAITAAAVAFNPVAAKAWQDIMSESARFLADRLRQDLNVQKAMLACKTPHELLFVQSEFYKKAVEQYAEGFTRLSKMMIEANRDTLEDARSGHSRGYDDVPI
jgi:hypothetical protein